MKFNLIVISISNTRAKKIIAHQLAHDPSIPLQKAMLMVEKPPFVLMKNLTSQELNFQSEQLSRLGVKFKAAEIKSVLPTDSNKTIPIPLSEGDLNAKPTGPVSIKTEKLINESKTAKRKDTFLLDETSVQYKKDNHLFITVISVIFALIIIAGLLTSGNRRYYNLKKTVKPIISSSPEKSDNKTKKGNSRKSNGSSRKVVSEKAKKESILWADSAIACDSDHQKAINFYKIAISFNKYNLNAWFGLLNAYRSAKMYKEEKRTRIEMKKIFGESIFSFSEMISPYGDIIDSYTTEDNVFRLEYRTMQSEKEDALDEIYKVTRIISGICKCESISVFASSSPGKGIIVHLNKNASLLSMDSFKKDAVISFLH